MKKSNKTEVQYVKMPAGLRLSEKVFLSYNERLKQRQSAVKTEKPVRIGELVSVVLADIERRRAGGCVR